MKHRWLAVIAMQLMCVSCLTMAADDASQSREALFEAESAVTATMRGRLAPLPESKDALFGEDAGMAKWAAGRSESTGVAADRNVNGFSQTEMAYTYAEPKRLSKALGRLELGIQGRLSQGVRCNISGRFDYNAVYDLSDYYQSPSGDSQKADFQLRETYCDFSARDLDWRVGRQHVIWGEMIGIFIADVVSAKDLREFILPDFQLLRIPQWAARAEYFEGDFHAEVIWIPFPSYDLTGKPKNFADTGAGSEFYIYPPALAPTILDDEKPGVRLKHTNYGVRINQLRNGWDLSGFYYSSMNSAPTLYQYVPSVFTPRHDRIWQTGGTLAKDYTDIVIKAEAVYTQGRRFNLLLPVGDGVVKQNTVDWAVGLEFNPTRDTRVNTQLYQRYFFDHDPSIIPDKAENGIALLISHNYSDVWKAEALLVHSLNRSDWMFRPKVNWGVLPNWNLTFGLDIFGGPPTGIFGQFDQRDRIYTELRNYF